MKNNKPILCLFVLQIILATGCREKEKQMMVTTGTASNIQYTSADVSGTIVDIGEGISQYGHCYAVDPDPKIDDFTTQLQDAQIGVYKSNLSGLEPGKTYYVKAYVTRGTDVVYGAEINFATPGTVVDIEINQYNVVKIGSQLWMKENLRTFKFNDGAGIGAGSTGTWDVLTTPGACCINDNTSTAEAYGLLYNWYAVNTGKLCPPGWHVPVLAEWNTLVLYLGGESVAGNKLKETGFNYWENVNTGATNESGFSARGAGFREDDPGAPYYGLNYNGFFWSNTELNAVSANCLTLYAPGSNAILWSFSKRMGLSVRCIKD
jgi:uncharacterized protein (TIGR02145 family)